MSKKIEILLVKEGETDISVTCLPKITLNFFRTLLAVRYGWPALEVRPKDWRGFGLDIGLLSGLFLFAAFGNAVTIIIAAIFYIIFFIRTKYYIWNFIQNKIDRGYTVPEEMKTILEDAGINFDGIDKSTRKGIDKIFFKKEKFERSSNIKGGNV